MKKCHKTRDWEYLVSFQKRPGFEIWKQPVSLHTTGYKIRTNARAETLQKVIKDETEIIPRSETQWKL